jgi:phosphoenolpyruvate carboxylase
LHEAVERGGEETLREMMARWPFFGSTLSMIAMVLAKASSGIARRYHERLVDSELKVLGDDLFDRLDRTRAMVEHLLGRGLLADNPVLERSIAVRNPYVDPLNLLQVEYLARVRQREDPEIVQALLVTINGVVAGMRNTG